MLMSGFPESGELTITPVELTELHEIKLMQLNVPFTSEGHDKDVLSIIVYVGGDNADIISLHQIRGCRALQAPQLGEKKCTTDFIFGDLPTS
uniref:Uncharacterized protein n=1 Tax=Oryza rufipogon TaxID=4529 RepID=A0A0E0NQ91_ORYRU